MPAFLKSLAWILVIGLLAGCAGGDAEPVRRDACGAKVQTFDGATRLTYRGADDVVADVPILCERLAALKLTSHVLGEGPRGLVVEVAAKDAATAKSAVRTGRLAVYDWEANVIGAAGKPAPADPEVTGGQAAGRAGSLTYYDAVVRAAKQPAAVESDNARKGSRYYAVDPDEREVLGTGAATRAAALAAVPAAQREAADVREVKPNTVVLRGEEAPDGGYFVLRDDVALRGGDIRDPAQRLADGPGGSGEPIVTFDFTGEGGRAFTALTRTLAERGARSVGAAPGRSSGAAGQHFAIVLDDQIVSVPYVDFRANPDGIDPGTGSQIQGAFTIASARALASVLDTGELPVALEPVGGTTP